MRDKIENALFSALKKSDEGEVKRIFEIIYNHYYKLVYFCIAKYINEEETIKELTNDAFLNFFENIANINSSIKYYLLTIAKNIAKNYLNKKNNFILVNDELIINYPDYSVCSNEVYTKLIDDLKAVLTNQEVEIIIKHVVDGMTFKELENIYHIKAKTINKMYERAIKKFKNSERSVYYEKWFYVKWNQF